MNNKSLLYTCISFCNLQIAFYQKTGVGPSERFYMKFPCSFPVFLCQSVGPARLISQPDTSLSSLEHCNTKYNLQTYIYKPVIPQNLMWTYPNPVSNAIC